jgi:hypothetical protein
MGKMILLSDVVWLIVFENSGCVEWFTPLSGEVHVRCAQWASIVAGVVDLFK